MREKPAQLIAPTDSRVCSESEPGSERTLRQRAEQIARDTPAESQEAIATLSPEDIQRVFHDIRVKQIELELQDKELQRAKAQIWTAQARCHVCQKRTLLSAPPDSEKLFRAIFMTAPICILIHDKDSGEMLEANPTACVPARRPGKRPRLSPSSWPT
ncbi:MULTISPECIES: hypothetical protein [Thiorhodovibrio]|uniref:hypothetical protein n=1 Tax=Thiorhodovibrio TaxID=61593 RepID=UPI001911CF44|nr:MULTISPECIES: hypothetical protein [Thiorhodovibrio]MBK5969964.1 hypothetical protein [Thiorhodovibrio winogradskyi]